ncbi:MAG: PCP reductase family protein, partial [Nitrospirota bacterium]
IRRQGERVVTYETLLRPRTGERIAWDPEAKQRLDRVPAAVRAMARIELERTAADRGLSRITVSLMEEIKAKYFGMAASK